MALGDNAPEIGRDALDAAAEPPRRLDWFPRRGAALGLRPSAAPSLVFITLGLLLGPGALDLLDADALVSLDAVVSVALAALGVFVGLGIGAMGRSADLPLVAAAFVQALLTIVTVAAGLYLLIGRWGIPVGVDLGLFAAAIAVCSCASAATRAGRDGRDGGPGSAAAVISDLDDVPLILLGTLLVIAGGGRDVATTIALATAASAVAGVAGWLLFERAASAAQRGVFVAGTLLLLGGIGAYAGSSPLLGGAIAALIWRRTVGAADRIIARDISRMQHPLVALLLIVAGASIQWSLALLWIAAPLVLLRLIGKLLGGVAAAQVSRLPVGMVSTLLLPPGVLGIALALNLYQVLGDAGVLLLSAVTVAAVVSELVAVVLPPDAEAG